MIRFGPAGNARSFYDAGYTSSLQAPRWLSDMGLSAYECSWGRGVTIGDETARALGKEARACDIQLSGHAPYYINFANPERREKSIDYVLQAARAMHLMGGGRVVVHVGAQQKRGRAEAFSNAIEGLLAALDALEHEGLHDVKLCPETMGMAAQLVNLDEMITLCKTDERLIPAVDFGHLHAVGGGTLRGRDDFARVLDRLADALPHHCRSFHVHFSRIEFTKAGEKRHRSYDEVEYGPDFDPLAQLLYERGLEPVIICESKDTMAEDAVKLKTIYEGYAQK